MFRLFSTLAVIGAVSSAAAAPTDGKKKSYAVSVEAPETAEVGQATSAKVKLVPGAGYKINKQYPSWGTRFEPTVWGKLTTIAEALLIGIYLLSNAIGRTSIALDLAKWTTLALILYSGFHYLFHATRVVRDEGPEDSQPG